VAIYINSHVQVSTAIFTLHQVTNRS